MMNPKKITEATSIKLKPIKLNWKSIKIDWKKAFEALGKATVMLLASKPVNAIKESLGILSVLGAKNDTEHFAYRFILQSLINATYNIVEENKNRLFNRFKKNEDLLESKEFFNFLEGINDFLKLEDINLTLDNLRNPNTLGVSSIFFNSYLVKWLDILGFSANEVEHFRHRFPAYFTLACQSTYQRSNDVYANLFEKLDTPMHTAIIQDLNWQEYYAYLLKQIEEPVFGETFSLKQIYISLRSYYNSSEKPFDKIVIDPKADLDEWLEISSKSFIKIISGGPGSGKSSFLKIWAASLAKVQKYRVIFIPLNLINLQLSVIDAIDEYFTLTTFFRINPLKEISKDSKKTVIIFDGLDELSKQGVIGEETAKDFLDQILKMGTQINNGLDKLRVIISGRELAIQVISGSLKVEKQVLHLLPYLLEELTWQAHNIKDFTGRINVDQRYSWWEKYISLVDLKNSKWEKLLGNPSLREITSQPLLNYLIALSFKFEEIDFDKRVNLNEVYEGLVVGVYNRAYENNKIHKAIENINDTKDFQRILQEISIAAWHGGDVRTTTINKIKTQIDEIKTGRLNQLFEDFGTMAKSGVTRLLTAFYFRQKGINPQGNQTFEFTHKSFGEYLGATRLVDFIWKIYKNRQVNKEDSDEGWDRRASLQKWLKLTGETPVSIYMQNFILGEISYRIDNPNYTNWSSNNLKKIQKTLAGLFSFIQKKGMPSLTKRRDQKEEARKTRNAEEALLVMLDACASQAKKQSKIEWESKLAFSEFLSKMQPARGQYGTSQVAYRALRYLILDNQVLLNKDLENANLEGANLRIVRFDNANLNNANLQNANLNNANLNNANLQNANLNNANLLDVNLYGANLNNANLQNANLNNANLELTTLKGSNLFQANLAGAGLKYTDFSDANLNKAQLSNLDLRAGKWKGATFQNANLNNANLAGLELHDSDFTDSNLNGTNLNGTVLISAKFADSNLNGTKFVYANLKGAYLTRANLNNANLTGANLNNARLVDADLVNTNFKFAEMEGVNLLGAYVNSVNFFEDLKTSNASGLEALMEKYIVNPQKIEFNAISKKQFMTPRYRIQMKIES